MLLIGFLGFFWGLNEGLWFFIVPDIILSFIALKGIKPVLYATLAVILGAMCACVGLYVLFANSPEALNYMPEFWSKLPGYYTKMFEVARGHLETGKAQGLISGPKSGIPYRFYILEAYKLDLPLLGLLVWTPLARLVRIILAPIAILILNFLGRKLLAKYIDQKKIKIGMILLITIYWIGLYVWYWGSFLPKTYGS